MNRYQIKTVALMRPAKECHIYTAFLETEGWTAEFVTSYRGSYLLKMLCGLFGVIAQNSYSIEAAPCIPVCNKTFRGSL